MYTFDGTVFMKLCQNVYLNVYLVRNLVIFESK